MATAQPAPSGVGIAQLCDIPQRERIQWASKVFLKHGQTAVFPPSPHLQLLIPKNGAAAFAGSGMAKTTELYRSDVVAIAPGQSMVIEATALGTTSLHWIGLTAFVKPKPICIGRAPALRTPVQPNGIGKHELLSARHTNGVWSELWSFAGTTPAPNCLLKGPALILPTYGSFQFGSQMVTNDVDNPQGYFVKRNTETTLRSSNGVCELMVIGF